MASPTHFHSSKTTLGAAVEAFFADRDLAPATRRAYRATYGSLIQAFGSEMPVTALTAVNLQHWLIRRWGKRSPATWNARLAASRVLIGYCQRQGWIEHDPTTSLERRRTPRDETRAIPFATFRALDCSGPILPGTAVHKGKGGTASGGRSTTRRVAQRSGYATIRRPMGFQGFGHCEIVLQYLLVWRYLCATLIDDGNVSTKRTGHHSLIRNNGLVPFQRTATVCTTLVWAAVAGR